MAIGIKRLRQLQLAAEVTPGTAVTTATALWRGLGTLKDDRVFEQVDEDIGYLSGVDHIFSSKLYGTLSMEPVVATFEQLPYILEAGVKTITPVQDGTGTDYIYDYPLSTTAANAVQSYTIKGGDNNEVEIMEYCLVESFTLDGKMDSAVMMSAKWFGRQVAVHGAGFTSLSVPAVNPIIAAKGILAIDDDDASFGDTPVSGTLLDWKLDWKTGVVPVFVADNGELYFETHKMIESEVKLEVTFEHETSAAAEKVNWRAGTKRLLQILIEGPEAATPGTAYTYLTLIINLPGYWETFSEISDQDGNNIVKGTFISKYNATAAQAAQIIVVNELSALP